MSNGNIHSNDNNGTLTKTVTEHKTTKDGKRVKVIKTVRVVQREVLTNKRVQERKHWRRFGLATNYANLEAEFGHVSSIGEPVYFEFASPAMAKKAGVSANRVATAAQEKHKQQLIDHVKAELTNINRVVAAKVEEQELRGTGVDASTVAALAASSSAANTGTYIPPALKRAMEREEQRQSGAPFTHGPRPGEEGCTVRVSNIAEEVDEGEIRTMFSRTGLIQRVKIPRYLSGDSKGFAFVTFGSPSDAQRAIEQFNGMRWNYLVLGVELADH